MKRFIHSIAFCLFFVPFRDAEALPCTESPITESAAIEKARANAREHSVIVDASGKGAIFREDVNRDGVLDFFASFDCGNHSCNFSLFLGFGDGRFCPVLGEIFLTAGQAKRIIKVEVNGDFIGFAGALGADSGIVAKYHIEGGTISEIQKRTFGPGDSDFRTYDEAVSAVEQTTAGVQSSSEVLP